MASAQFKLPAELQATLKLSLRELADALPELDKAEQCGVECAMWRQERDEAVNRITTILKHYGD